MPLHVCYGMARSACSEVFELDIVDAIRDVGVTEDPDQERRLENEAILAVIERGQPSLPG